MNAVMLPPLPFPPSVNTYWRSIVIRGAVRVLISKKGREYRKAVAGVIGPRKKPTDKRLKVRITVNPPDRRKRDLDNMPKAILDALTHAGVWEDDSQIDELTIMRREVIKGGAVWVTVVEMEQEAAA